MYGAGFLASAAEGPPLLPEFCAWPFFVMPVKRQKCASCVPWLAGLAQRTLVFQHAQRASDVAVLAGLKAAAAAARAVWHATAARAAKRLARAAVVRAAAALQEFTRRPEHPAGPLDWSRSLYVRTWTRAAHAKYPYPVNPVVAALLLGLHVLEGFGAVPFVDPEVLEEALVFGVCLNDSSSYVSTPAMTGFVRTVGGAPVASGMVRACVSYNSVFTGVVCGRVAFGTHVTASLLLAEGPRRRYTGRLAVYDPDDLEMVFSGDDEELEHCDDGTVYRGGFRDGLYFGAGTFRAGATVLYTGGWKCVPHGAGTVRVTWADTPRGVDVYLAGAFDHGTATGDYVMTDALGVPVCDAVVAAVVAAGCHWNQWGMSHHYTADGRAVVTFGQSVLAYYISRRLAAAAGPDDPKSVSSGYCEATGLAVLL